MNFHHHGVLGFWGLQSTHTRYFHFWTKVMMIKVEFTYFTHNIQYLRLFYATFWTDMMLGAKRNKKKMTILSV